MLKKMKYTFTALAFVTSWNAWAQLQCMAIPELMKVYFIHHVSSRSLNADRRQKTINQFIESLDPSKTVFLKEDVERMQRSLSGIFETALKDDCSSLVEAQAMGVKRAREMENVVRNFVGPSYKLDLTTTFQMDSKKRDYPKTVAERDELLRKFVHFQISNYLSGDTKIDEAKKQLIHRYELITKRFQERKPDQLRAMFLDAFANSLDPHSSYYSKQQFEDFQIDMGLELEGIGASLSSQDGFTVVEEIIAGGPADRARLSQPTDKALQPKDKILAVGQGDSGPFQSVMDWELRDVVQQIRGKGGTKVRLRVLRMIGGGSERLEVEIVRAKVKLEDSAARLSFETRKTNKRDLKIAVISLPSFYGDSRKGGRSSFNDIKKLVDEAKAAKADGIMLNLVRNGGGLLEDAYNIAGLFIRKGPIVASQGVEDTTIFEDKDDATQWNGPLVILTSRVSASASEILAGALRDYQRALVVGGDNTFGKGTVQAVFPLREWGAMKVTTSIFYLPSGKSTQHAGVASDVVIPSLLNNEKIGEAAYDNSLRPSSIKPFLGKLANHPKGPDAWTPVRPEEVALARTRSQARVAKDPKFAEILKDINEDKKNVDGVIKLSEVHEKSMNEKKKKQDEERKSVAERIRDADAPLVNEAVNVLADLIGSRSGETVVFAKVDDQAKPQ